MTPTYLGRIQTRFFLLITVGVFTTWLFTLANPLRYDSRTYVALVYVFIFGLGWDFIYDRWQQRRWDHDWPPSHQLLAGIIEGIFLWFVASRFSLPGMQGAAPLMLVAFRRHYSTVWVLMFIASQSLMRLLFPRWRYFGGEWLT